MRQAGIALSFVVLAAGGALTASVLAGTPPGVAGSPAESTVTTDTAVTATTETTTTDTTATIAPSSTSATTTGTAPKPRPKSKPKPLPKPKPKPRLPEPVLLPARVSVGGVHVGGLTPATAEAAVRVAFRSPLILRVGPTWLAVSPRRLGAVAYFQGAIARARNARAGSAVPLVVTIRGELVRAYVDSLATRFDRRPVDARLLLRHFEPFVIEERPGLAIDRVRAVTAIVGALRANRRGTLDVPAKTRRPAVTQESFGPFVVILRESKRLRLYRGARLVREFVVATGQSGYATPLGRFRIVVKWRDPWWYPPPSTWARGRKPVPPGPGNPLGTRWMGLSAPYVGIHGTPDAASLGYSASHGCIRMFIPSAEWLFQHVEVGTPVFIVAG